MTDLPLHAVSETARTITLGHDPVPDAIGFRLSPVVKAGVVQEGKWAHSWDGAATQHKFSPGHEPYRVQALMLGVEGVYPHSVVGDHPSPPTLISPVTLTPRQGDSRFNLQANQDFILDMSAGPLEQYAGGACLLVNGGRNGKTYGPIITHSPNLQGAGIGNDFGYSVYVVGLSGRLSIERHEAYGDGLAQALVLACPYGDVDVLTYRYEAMHPVWHKSSGKPAEVHTDAIQSWGGGRQVRMYDGSIYTCGSIFQVMPNQYGASPLGLWVTRRLNAVQVANPLSDEMPFALTKNSPQKWAWDQEDVWVSNLGTLAGANGWPGDGIAGWTPGASSWPVSGEAWRVGVRPEGDFTPRPS